MKKFLKVLAIVLCSIAGILLLVIGIVVMTQGLGGNDDKNVEDLNFAECYSAYKENELRADETYKGNRYRLTAKVRNIQSTDSSLLYWDDEIIVQFEIMVDDTHVVGEALFEKDQAESLKEINIGDTITFVGECRSAGAWIECELE